MAMEDLARRQAELRSELEVVQMELQETSMTLRRLEDRKKKLMMLKDEQMHLRCEMDEAAKRLEQSDMHTEGVDDLRRIQKMQSVFVEKSKQIDEEIISLEREIAELTAAAKEAPRSKHFDKRIPLSNIREMVKNNPEIKLGQIEKESGNNPGYMSRLEKEGNSSDPTVEFLVTAAEMLGVSLDRLIKKKMTALTPTEEYLIPFVKSLIEDTNTETILWDKETPAVFDSAYMNPRSQNHPLIDTLYEDEDEDGVPAQTGIGYQSRFYPNCGITPVAACYHAELPNQAGVVYIAKCRKGDDSMVWRKDEFYEVYISTSNGLMTDNICTTLQTSDSLSVEIDTLYKEIELASTHVRIESTARSAIDRYLSKRK